MASRISGARGYDDPSIHQALGVFTDAIAKHDKRMAHVYFDISGIASIGQWKEKGELIATRLRQLGLHRCTARGAQSRATPRSLPQRTSNSFSSNHLAK